MKLLRALFSFRDERALLTAHSASGMPGRGLPKPTDLADLLHTIWKMGASLVGGILLAYCLEQPLFRLVMSLLPKSLPVLHIEVVGIFLMRLNLWFYGGLVFSFPLLVWFAAAFVLPPLSKRLRPQVISGLAIGFLLFGGGVLVSFEYILPRVIQWLFDSSGMISFLYVDPSALIPLIAYCSITVGLACKLPVAVSALSILGVVSHRLLARARIYAFSLLLILAAVLWPKWDPITLLTSALPFIAIYEVCFWLAWGIDAWRASRPPAFTAQPPA
jgi:sec-independent protein translocase protein TatC